MVTRAANVVEEKQDKPKSQSKTIGRGPSYPALAIEEAIAKAKEFWDAEKRSSAPVAAAAKHWGYSETSSSGKVVVATLLQYGLMEDNGSKEGRTVKLSERGLTILLHEPDSPERLRAIQEAVMAPKLNAALLAKWPADELPSDQTLHFYLVREKHFNETAVADFIEDFRASVTYAGLDKPVPIPEVADTSESSRPGSTKDLGHSAPDVGDLIQRETSGIRMGSPRRVRAKQERAGEWWVFVDESEVGIPINEVVIIEKKGPDVAAQKAPPTMALPTESTTLTPSMSEREWLRGPLSRDTSYRLVVSGNLGPREIGKLIKLLEAQKAVLDDDDTARLP